MCAGPSAKAGMPPRKVSAARPPLQRQQEDWDEYVDDEDEAEAGAPDGDWRSMLQGITNYNPNK